MRVLLCSSRNWFDGIDIDELKAENSTHLLADFGYYDDGAGVFDLDAETENISVLKYGIDPLNSNDRGLSITKHPDFIIAEEPSLVPILASFIESGGEASFGDLERMSNFECECWSTLKACKYREELRDAKARQRDREMDGMTI